MNLAIVCEWIEATGGAEKVLDAMSEAYPGADVYTLWNDAPERLPGVVIRESWMARTPLRNHKALAMPLMSPTWRRRRSSQHLDRVLVSSYAFAHHARFLGQFDVPRRVYVHSPARYLWAPEIDPRGQHPLVRLGAPFMKELDRRRAAESDSMVANSHYVRARIAKAWGLETNVIYPPVDTEWIQSRQDWREALTVRDEERLAKLPSEFILGASRLVDYKRLDSVLDFAESVRLPAVIVGSGPARQKLEHQALGSDVKAHFLGEVSSELLYALYQRCTAYVFPPIEDFGIMPVEAMATGGRVIVNRVGGAGESVIDKRTGVQISDFRGDSARVALENVQRIGRDAARASTARFSKMRFAEELKDWVATS